MYDLVFIGDSIESPNMNTLSIKPELLVKSRGEIGNFNISYKNTVEDSQLNKIKTSNIIINLDTEKEKLIEDTLSFEEDLISKKDDLAKNEYILFVQDYLKTSPAIMSKFGLEKAITLNKELEKSQIYYFYRSMRFIDENDRLFEEARRNGIIFLKYEPEGLIISDDNKLTYKREDIELEFNNQIIMAPGIKANNYINRVARIFNLEMGPDGFLQPENVYLTPTYTGKRGIYVLGGSRGITASSNFEEELEFTLNEIAISLENIEPVVSDERVVDDQKCILCYTCYRVCPHGAVERDEELNSMKINQLACQGCNACISNCPANAISIVNEEEKEIKQGLHVLMRENSAQTSFDKLNQDKFSDLNVETIPCSSSIRKKELYTYLQEPENRLLILGCYEESCKHINGDKRGEQIVDEVKRTLEKLNMNKDRIAFKRISPRMAEDLDQYLSNWKEGLS